MCVRGVGDELAISLSSLDKLPSVIDTLIIAVRNREFDQQLAEEGTPPAKLRAGGVA
jgi:hypothetical protein